MLSFKQVLGVSKEYHYINLLDTTTNSFVSFTNVDFETLRKLVRKKEIPHDRFVQQQAWINNKTRMRRDTHVPALLVDGKTNPEFNCGKSVGNFVYRYTMDF